MRSRQKVTSGPWTVGRHKAVLALIALTLCVPSASAFQVHRGRDLKVLWDTTLKYSNAWRVGEQEDGLIDDVNSDDGDRNFDGGLVSNRFDVLSELDVTYKGIGARVSGAAWYDFVYNSDNDNDSPATANSVSVAHDEFTDDTEELHGKKAEILDAFVFGRGSVGDVLGTVRVGQHTLLWGESLLFATNGISYGQAPLDVIKLLSVPGTKAKELFRPVPQVSVQIQPFASLSLAGFYQWQWEESRLPAAGSYVSDVDILDEGGETLIAGPPPAPGLGPAAFYRGDDQEAGDSGQWGVAARFQPPWIDVQFGLYYYVFHERVPQVYLTPGIALGPPPPGAPPGPPPIIDASVLDPNNPAQIGEYSLVYGEDIKVIGGSFSTQVGETNVAGEVSYRMDTPLVSTPQVVLPGVPADNDDNPLYAVGNTVHANLSAVHFLSPSWLWDGGMFLGEIGWNRRTSTDKNSAAADPTRDRTAWGFRFVLEPAWYQVLPGIDLKVPLGLGYNPKGKSAVDPKFNGGADEGGDWSVGVNVDYLQVWKFGIKYTDFFGPSDTQTLQDRDFISFSLERTF